MTVETLLKAQITGDKVMLSYTFHCLIRIRLLAIHSQPHIKTTCPEKPPMMTVNYALTNVPDPHSNLFHLHSKLRGL